MHICNDPFLPLDGSLYLLDPNSVKIQHRIPLANISHISASQLPDNFFIVHVPSEQDRLFVSGYVQGGGVLC